MHTAHFRKCNLNEKHFAIAKEKTLSPLFFGRGRSGGIKKKVLRLDRWYRIFNVNSRFVFRVILFDGKHFVVK